MTRKSNPFIGGSFDAQSGGTLRLSLLDDAVDLQLALRALSREVEAKLLANPRVLVLDNETANFEIVREIPYRELQQIGRADPITYTAFKNVGIQLKVTPHVAAGGMIRLRISPQFGMVVSMNLDGVPTVDTRRADTTAMLKDGQTIVIGGLRKREISKAVSKVPILGDMPLVGGLFQSRTEAAQINELVVFITTRIVREPVLSDSERQQLRISQIATRDIRDIEAERELTEMLLKSLSEQK
jgi:type II secretory pathway component GspD/PulD (secretin)